MARLAGGLSQGRESNHVLLHTAVQGRPMEIDEWAWILEENAVEWYYNYIGVVFFLRFYATKLIYQEGSIRDK